MLARLDAVPRNGKLNGRSEAAKPKFNRRKLDSLLGFQLRLAYIAISRHFAVAVSQVNLTQKQTGALWLIGSNAGVSQIELAKELGIDRASMMVIIDRLEERRLIARERTPRDGRLKALFLTTKGAKDTVPVQDSHRPSRALACGAFQQGPVARTDAVAPTHSRLTAPLRGDASSE